MTIRTFRYRQTPAQVTGLSATPASSNQINLAWTAVSGATAYRVYRNGALVGTPSGTSYSATGLAASTQYTFTVSATASGIEGPQSAAAGATTQAGGFNPGNPLFFDAFNYIVTSNSAQASANAAAFAAAGWSGVKAINCGATPSGACGNLYTVTPAEIPGHVGAAPGSVQRALCINSLALTYGLQSDFYLQLGSTLGDIPPDVWFQFWVYPCRSGVQQSQFHSRDKFIYPTINTYPAGLNSGLWLYEFGQSNSWNPNGDGSAAYWAQDAGAGNAWGFTPDTQCLNSRPNYNVPYAVSNSIWWKLGQNTNERIVANRWTLVKFRFNTAGAGGMFQQWMRSAGGAWVQVADWRSGVTPANFTWNVEPQYRSGHAMIRMPSTLPGANATPQYNLWLYMQDFAMASTEAALPTYE